LSSNLAAPRRPLVLADLLPSFGTNALPRRTRVVARDIALVIAAAGITGALAQISIHIPGTPVPMTGQTLGVLVSGCALGWKRASAAMLAYALLGFVGVPWFAGGQHGYVGANAGYLLGFILAAYLCGFVAERGADRKVIGALPAMLLGEIAIYAIGVPWLAIDLHLGVGKAISEGFTPFIAGDATKAAIGAALLPGAWHFVNKQH
jgi:biotin transport system substrate-specific component